MVKYDIFISYSLQDCDEVKEFVSLLKTYIPTLVCCTDITSEEFD